MNESQQSTWLSRCLTGLAACSAIVGILLSGCGTTNQRKATEQLIMSDAVDRAVGEIDFSPLTGSKVYFEDRYIRPVDGIGFVNAPYIISALRQQLVSAGCLIQETREEADIIVEGRVGTLGADGHEMTFGVPKSSALSSATAALSSAQVIPVIPEIAVAKIDRQTGAAKVGVYAYERESKQPVWQSGIRTARSSSKDTYVLGAGPWQRGSIHERTRLAGRDIGPKGMSSPYQAPPVSYHAEVVFPRNIEEKVVEEQIAELKDPAPEQLEPTQTK